MEISQAALHDVDLSGLGEVEFHFDRIHTTGGRLKTAMPMVSRKVRDKGLLVKMSTNEAWLIFATTGDKFQKTNIFGNKSLLEALRRYVEKACNGRMAVKDTIEEGADYDPST